MENRQLLEVLTKYYPKLHDTLADIHHLLPHFVSEGIIKYKNEEEINVLMSI